MTTDGKAIRLSTYVDIPTEIGLPHFIQDDLMKDEGPLYGNFKLSLQAVVCHRGDSVDSGHYISLVRGTSPNAYTPQSSSPQSTDEVVMDVSNHWMRFDDLAPERITLVDIEQALKTESPYLLFYQILPIEDASEYTVPSSADSELFKGTESGGAAQEGIISPTEVNDGTNMVGDEKGNLTRPSLGLSVPDTSRAVDPVARQSVTYSDSTANEDDVPPLRAGMSSSVPTPKEEDGRSSFSFSRRKSKASKGSSQSRTEKDTNDSRKSSMNISRATSRISRDKSANDKASENMETNAEGNGEAGCGGKQQSEKGEKAKQLKKRDKSKGKEKQKQRNSTLRKSDKPDRECAVM